MGAQQLPSSDRRPQSDAAATVFAGAGSLANAMLISALLQGTRLPEMFVEEESERLNVTAKDDELLDIPVIDLAVLRTGDADARKNVVAAMADACEKFGFFQVANHGVDLELVASCEAQANRLFQLPLEVKEIAHRNPGEKFGYGANTWVDQTVKHWAESFALQLNPENNVREYASKLFGDANDSFRYKLLYEHSELLHMFWCPLLMNYRKFGLFVQEHLHGISVRQRVWNFIAMCILKEEK